MLDVKRGTKLKAGSEEKPGNSNFDVAVKQIFLEENPIKNSRAYEDNGDKLKIINSFRCIIVRKKKSERN